MEWRSHIDALAFHPDGRQEQCVVHRRAFRTLLGFDPSPQDCECYFRANRAAFEAAARAKILEKNITSGLSFHLTSRDIARQLRSPSNAGPAKV
ncbi:MAG TPA: DUF1488 family protein [Pseudolabrys sp.]